MKKQQSYQKLPLILKNLAAKSLRQAFTKIMLVQDPQEEDCGRIRHYDIECEAVNMMADTLQPKIRKALFHSFVELKNPKRYRMKKKKGEKGKVSVQNFFPRIQKNLKAELRLNFNQNSENQLNKMNIEDSFSNEGSIKKIPKTQEHIPEDKDFGQSTERSEKMHKRKLILSKLMKIQNQLKLLHKPELKTPSFKNCAKLFKKYDAVEQTDITYNMLREGKMKEPLIRD